MVIYMKVTGETFGCRVGVEGWLIMDNMSILVLWNTLSRKKGGD
jgi:hypothetical protein